MSGKSFTDTKGRTWDLTLSLADARRIDKTDFVSNGYLADKVSFLQPTRELLTALSTKTDFMFALIWSLILPQAKKKFLDGSFLFGKTALDMEFARMSDNQPTSMDSIRRSATAAGIDSLPKKMETAFSEEYEFAEEEFVSGIGGTTITDARSALWGSLADFFPDQKTILSMLERQLKKTIALGEKKVLAMESDLENSIEQAMDAQMMKAKASLQNLKTLETSSGGMS